MLCDTLKVPDTDLLSGRGPRTSLLNIDCHKDPKQERESPQSVMTYCHTRTSVLFSCVYTCPCFNRTITPYVITPDSIEEATQDDLSTLTMPFDSGMKGSLFERRFQEVFFLLLDNRT